MISVTWMTLTRVAILIPTTLGGVFISSLDYYYFPKYGRKIWFTGPVQTINIPGCSVGIDGGKRGDGPTIKIMQAKL